LSKESKQFLSAPLNYVAAGTATIAFRKIGAGDPLLFLHGWPLTSVTFRRLIPLLEKHFTCYLPDLPGCGESRWTKQTDFSIEGRAKILATLIDELDLRNYFMLAHDTGATIGRMLARLQADRIRKFAIINTEIPFHRPPWIPLYQRLMVLPGSNLLFRQLLRSRQFLRSQLGFGSCFCDLTLLEGDFRELVVMPLIASPGRLEGQARAIRGINWSVVDSLARIHGEIRAPVLLVWGEQDQTFPIHLAKQMATQFSNCAGFEAIPNAKLLVHEEQPEQVAASLLRFFLDNGAGR